MSDEERTRVGEEEGVEKRVWRGGLACSRKPQGRVRRAVLGRMRVGGLACSRKVTLSALMSTPCERSSCARVRP